MKKYISSDTLCDLAKVVLKNNIFKFGKKILKQKRGTAIGLEFAPPYIILFMTKLEEEILWKAEFKLYLWWRYIEDIFFLWEHGEEKLKSFIDNINKMHPTIKFSVDWSKTSIYFFDATVFVAQGVMKHIYMLNLLTVTNIFYHLSAILFIAKRVYHTARH